MALRFDPASGQWIDDGIGYNPFGPQPPQGGPMSMSGPQAPTLAPPTQQGPWDQPQGAPQLPGQPTPALAQAMPQPAPQNPMAAVGPYADENRRAPTMAGQGALAQAMPPSPTDGVPDPTKASTVAPFAAVGTPSASGRDPGAPRGVRNNNPLNLEYREGQPSVLGSDGRFGVYPTMEAGYDAAHNQLKLYGQRGINTITGIISRWAPSSDGNDVNAYIRRVSQATGIDPNKPLDMNDRQTLQPIMEAMAHHENGVPVPGGGKYATLTGPPPRGGSPDQGGDVQMAQNLPPGSDANMSGASFNDMMGLGPFGRRGMAPGAIDYNSAQFNPMKNGQFLMALGAGFLSGNGTKNGAAEAMKNANEVMKGHQDLLVKGSTANANLALGYNRLDQNGALGLGRLAQGDQRLAQGQQRLTQGQQTIDLRRELASNGKVVGQFTDQAGNPVFAIRRLDGSIVTGMIGPDKTAGPKPEQTAPGAPQGAPSDPSGSAPAAAPQTAPQAAPSASAAAPQPVGPLRPAAQANAQANHDAGANYKANMDTYTKVLAPTATQAARSELQDIQTARGMITGGAGSVGPGWATLNRALVNNLGFSLDPKADVSSVQTTQKLMNQINNAQSLGQARAGGLTIRNLAEFNAMKSAAVNMANDPKSAVALLDLLAQRKQAGFDVARKFQGLPEADRNRIMHGGVGSLDNWINEQYDGDSRTNSSEPSFRPDGKGSFTTTPGGTNFRVVE